MLDVSEPKEIQAAQCFVYEFPLVNPSFKTEKIALKRLETARLMKNELITEVMRRHNLMRQTKRSKKLICTNVNLKNLNSAIYKNSEIKKEYNQGYADLKKDFDLLGSYSLATFVAKLHKKFDSRVGSNRLPCTLVHQLANEVWESYEPFLYAKKSGEGKRGEPRRRGYRYQLTCISSRSTEKNKGPLKYDSLLNEVTWSNGATLKSQKSVLKFRPRFVEDDYYFHALKSIKNDGIKQLRIGYRLINGRRDWFCQLILAGVPFKRDDLISPLASSVGVDVGVRDIAIVAPDLLLAKYVVLNPEVVRALHDNKIKARRARQAQDRSRRNSNPDCYDEKGRPIQGKRPNVRSKAYQAISDERREFERKLNETKKMNTNAQANEIIKYGKNVHFEKVEYSKWQKRSGKSMLASTPGALQTAVENAAKKYDRHFVSIDTYPSKLSQRCPKCDDFTKINATGPTAMFVCKHCGWGPVQRDIKSAFLAAFTDAAGKCDTYRALKAWSGMSKSLATEVPHYNVSSASSKEILNSTLLFVENQLKTDVGESKVGLQTCPSAMRNHQLNYTATNEYPGDHTAVQTRLRRKKRYRAQKRQQQWSVIYTARKTPEKPLENSGPSQ